MSQLKNYFIHYYIETFFCLAITFLILFSLFFFSSDILLYLLFPYSIFLFVSSSDNFCIYLLVALLIFFYHFHNNLLLCLVSLLGFFDNRLNQHSHSFLYIITFFLESTPFINQGGTIYYANCINFAHIPKINSASTSLNINNSNIIKAHSFLH